MFPFHRSPPAQPVTGPLKSPVRGAATGLVLGLATALGPVAAPAQEDDSAIPRWSDILSVDNIATSLLQSTMLTARFFADIRYDHVSFDPLAMRLTLVGADIRPHLPGFAPDACTVTAARISVSGQPLDRPVASRLHVGIDDAEIGGGCLPAEARGLAFAVGLRRIQLPRVDMDIRYDYASGGADMALSADLADVAAAEMKVVADYVSFRMDPETEEPRFAVDLASAHLALDDRGGWKSASGMLPAEMQDPAALQQIVAGAIAGILSDANGPAAPQLSEAQQGFTAQAGASAAAFVQGARRIVLASNIAGGNALRLDEDSTRDFQQLFDALAPSIGTHAPALDTAIPVAVLKSALDAEGLPENAKVLGRALLTGVGAPRNRANGLSLLAKLSRKGDAEAAWLVADALASDDPSTAYGHAMRAAALNWPGALSLLDRTERDISYERMMEVQNGATQGGPDKSLFGSVLAMRETARAYLNGTGGTYRSYRAAYYWASMAAAAGDASGAAMRDEIEELMRLRGDSDAWAKEIASLENGVLRDWMASNVPAGLR